MSVFCCSNTCTVIPTLQNVLPFATYYTYNLYSFFFLFFFFFLKTITHYIVALRAWSVNVQLQVTLFIVKHIKLTKSYLCSCGCLSDKRVGSMFTKQDKCVEKLSFPGGEGCCFCLLVVGFFWCFLLLLLLFLGGFLLFFHTCFR